MTWGPRNSTECSSPRQTDLGPAKVTTDVERTGARQWREPCPVSTLLTDITTREINPDTDIHPAQHHRLIALQPSVGDSDRVVRCYAPQGRLLGTIAETRVRHLWRRWCWVRNKRNQGHSVHDFAADVAALLRRYDKDLTNHWATPGALMQAMKNALNITMERFASPLNVSETTTHYYSYYKEDEVFGAAHDAYSAPFLVPSEINPEYTPEQLHKALKWAVQSTYMEGHPQVHVLVYPVWRGEPYKKWLAHPRVHRLCRIPQGKFDFIPPDNFTGVTVDRRRQCTKWEVDLLLVANPAGLRQRFSHATVQSYIGGAAAWLAGQPVRTDPPPREMWEEEQARPKGMPRSTRVFDAGQLGDMAPPPDPPLGLPDDYAEPALTLPQLARDDLRYDKNAYVYTDGSLIKAVLPDGSSCQKIGAAVHDAVETATTLVDPMTRGGVNHTIMRAELAALHAALTLYDDREDLKILTDSQSSIHAILNELHRPMRTANHLHRETLEAIAGLLVGRDRRGLHTTILKVRSHIGVRGNEVADAAAKLQALGGDLAALTADEWHVLNWSSRITNADRPHEVHVGRHPPRRGPLRLVVPGADTRDEQTDGTREDYTADDPGLHEHVARMCRNYGSNQRADHYVMLQRMNDPSLRRHKVISSRYMTTSKFTHSDRRLIKQLLYGTFQTQKRDHFMRPETYPSPNCVLCAGIHKDGPQPDGCGHAMGGCQHPQLHARYIKRHNDAVALIARAITEGEYGRWLVVADLNVDERDSLSERVRGLVQARLPDWMLPHMSTEDRNKMRPDLMFVIGAEEGAPEPPTRATGSHRPVGRDVKQPAPDPARQRVVIIEVGYARYSDMADELEEKMKQHQALADALQHPTDPSQRAWETEIVPVVLGHCGSVLQSSMDAMRALGVSKDATDRLFKDLHDNAITHTASAAWSHRALRLAANLEAGRRWRNKRKRSG